MTNLIFFGSDQYSEIVISSLIESQKFATITVVTDRGKPKDRDQKVEPNPVEKIAINHEIKVLYYPSNKDEMSTFIANLELRLLGLGSAAKTIGLCTSFDHLVPSLIIDLFRGHLYNLHPSLLPQYRNVAPIQYALALGDQTTGITLFKISSGIDNGEIVGQVSEPISPDDTTPLLSARLFKKGAELFLQLIENNLRSTAPTAKPSLTTLIFTRRLTRDSGYLEWSVLQKLIGGKSISQEETANHLLTLRLQKESSSSNQTSNNYLFDLARALNPWPGIWTIAPTKKGDLRLSIESVKPELMVKLAGKPKPVTWSQFVRSYLET